MSYAPNTLGKTTYRVVAACLLATCSLLILPTGVAAQGVTVLPQALDVPEGDSAQYTVVLTTEPTHDVEITVLPGADADLTASPGTSEDPLSFTDSNWNTPQTVTVSAKEDDDGVDGIALFQHTVVSDDSRYSGISVDSVTATEVDNDEIGITVVRERVDSDNRLLVPEGGSAQYTVVLNTQPVMEIVTITLGRSGTGGDADLTADTGEFTEEEDPEERKPKLTFTVTSVRLKIE